MEYRRSPLPRSDLYIESLPLWTRGLMRIPDLAPLVRELRLLQRRTARSGKDSVDHGPAGSDDYANALCGAAYLCAKPAVVVMAPPIVVMTPLAIPGDVSTYDPMRAVLGIPPAGGRGWGPN
jgi:hypothetical protein